jgi:hypothetical protein
MTTIVDDRTAEQRLTHTVFVRGMDKFMSGWGGAEGGTSVAAWACRPENLSTVEARIRSRGDLSRITVTRRIRAAPGCAHIHIYVAD